MLYFTANPEIERNDTLNQVPAAAANHHGDKLNDYEDDSDNDDDEVLRNNGPFTTRTNTSMSLSRLNTVNNNLTHNVLSKTNHLPRKNLSDVIRQDTSGICDTVQHASCNVGEANAGPTVSASENFAIKDTSSNCEHSSEDDLYECISSTDSENKIFVRNESLTADDVSKSDLDREDLDLKAGISLFQNMRKMETTASETNKGRKFERVEVDEENSVWKEVKVKDPCDDNSVVQDSATEKYLDEQFNEVNNMLEKTERQKLSEQQRAGHNSIVRQSAKFTRPLLFDIESLLTVRAKGRVQRSEVTFAGMSSEGRVQRSEVRSALPGVGRVQRSGEVRSAFPGDHQYAKHCELRSQSCCGTNSKRVRAPSG